MTQNQNNKWYRVFWLFVSASQGSASIPP